MYEAIIEMSSRLKLVLLSAGDSGTDCTAAVLRYSVVNDCEHCDNKSIKYACCIYNYIKYVRPLRCCRFLLNSFIYSAFFSHKQQ